MTPRKPNPTIIDQARALDYDNRMTIKDLDAAIRRVPDFPKPGIRFYDITSVLANPRAFAFCVDALTSTVRDSRSEAIARAKNLMLLA